MKVPLFSGLFLSKEREYFVENLSMLVASGMPVLSALDAILQETRSSRMKRVLGTLKENIDAGFPLWRALKDTGLFKEHTVSLIRVGEEIGKLPENLKLIQEQEAKERSFRSKIRSAMMYPLFVLFVTLVVGVGVAWFILPRLASVFSSLKLELPLLTKLLIGAGSFLGDYGAIALPIFFVVLALIIYIVFYFPKTKVIGQNLLFSFPGIKNLILEVELSRFGYLLGSLLQAGLPITKALSSLASATSFPHYKKLYLHLQGSIEEGNSFQKSFASFKNTRKLIPTPIQQLIAAGEQSGNLSLVLLRISETFEEKTETTTKNLTVILEPILLVIVWLGVVAVALAVILPIYNLIGGLQAT